jgi:hypothetical protein
MGVITWMRAQQPSTLRHMDRKDEMVEVDPEDFLRALLKISPGDAQRVREDTPGTRKRPEPQTGPRRDHGDENGPDQ